MTRVGQHWICGAHDQPVAIAVSDDAGPARAVLMTGRFDRLPSMLALPLNEYAVEPHPVMRLHRLCDAAEILTRFCTVVALGEVRQKAGSDPLPEELLRELQPRVEYPTFGKWKAMFEALIRHCPRTAPLEVPELIELARFLLPVLPGGEASSPERCLITLRNNLVHGGGTTRAEAKRLLDIWEPCLREELLPRLAFVEELELCRLAEGTARRLIGPDAAEGPERPMSAALALALRALDGHVVLLRGDRWLDLWPLCDYGRACQTSLLGTRTAAAESPLVYVRAQTDRLLYAALGVELALGERLDVVGSFRTLFQLEARQAQPSGRLPDYEDEIRADADAFVGRKEELTQVKAAVKAAELGVLWISGPGGIGKSYLVAKVAADLGNTPGTWRIAWRFEASDLSRCSRVAFLRHAVERLAGKLGRGDAQAAQEATELETQLAKLLDESTAFATPRTGNPPRVLFVLDGLDEVERIDPRFPQLPFRFAKSGVVWLCAGRPEGMLPSVFAAERCEHVFRDEGGLPAMRADEIRGLLVDRTGSLKYDLLRRDEEKDVPGKTEPAVVNAAVDAIVAKARGLPLYVRFVVEDVVSGALRFADLEHRLPPSLEAYYDDLLRRLSIGDLQALLTPLLVTVAWARAPLDEETLLLLMVRREIVPAGETGRLLLRRGLAALASMLRPAPVPGGELGYEPYHETFRAHIREDRAGLLAHQNQVAREKLCALVRDWSSLPEDHPALGYVLRQGPVTLIDEGRWDDLETLLLDPEQGLFFLEAKAEAGMVFDLVEDFGEAVERIPNNLPSHRIVRLLGQALRSDLHFLARHPTTLLQCLWNRCWWYDSPQAAHCYDLPPGGLACRGRSLGAVGSEIVHLDGELVRSDEAAAA
jgi:hypothetical protein